MNMSIRRVCAHFIVYFFESRLRSREVSKCPAHCVQVTCIVYADRDQAGMSF